MNLGGVKLEQKTLLKDWCWVCGTRFKTSVPPGPANREDHHIVPRNAGGTDGPQVSLCDSHHTVVHKIASRAKTGNNDFISLLAGEPKDQQQKLLWLASVIVRAERQVDQDPNKRFGSSVSLSKQELAMVKRLKSIYPEKTQPEILKLGLYALFRSHFPNP